MANFCDFNHLNHLKVSTHNGNTHNSSYKDVEPEQSLWFFRQAANKPLPHNWEMRYTPDGIPYFVDHNTRTTTFNGMFEKQSFLSFLLQVVESIWRKTLLRNLTGFLAEEKLSDSENYDVNIFLRKIRGFYMKASLKFAKTK